VPVLTYLSLFFYRKGEKSKDDEHPSNGALAGKESKLPFVSCLLFLLQ